MPAPGNRTPQQPASLPRPPLPSDRVSPDNGACGGQDTARLLAAADTTTAQLSALSVVSLPMNQDGQATAALRSTVEMQGAMISDYKTEVGR